MPKRPEMLLWLSDARGQYIPRDFAKSFADRAKHVAGVTDEQWAILESGPEGGMDSDDNASEWYWEVWGEVCDDAIVTDTNGDKFRIYQDGDCWLVPVNMEWNDKTESFDYADERETTDEA